MKKTKKEILGASIHTEEPTGLELDWAPGWRRFFAEHPTALLYPLSKKERELYEAALDRMAKMDAGEVMGASVHTEQPEKPYGKK